MLVTRAAVRPAEFSWTRSTDQPGPTSNGLLRVSLMPLILVTSSAMAKWRRKPGIPALLEQLALFCGVGVAQVFLGGG